MHVKFFILQYTVERRFPNTKIRLRNRSRVNYFTCTVFISIGPLPKKTHTGTQVENKRAGKSFEMNIAYFNFRNTFKFTHFWNVEEDSDNREDDNLRVLND